MLRSSTGNSPSSRRLRWFLDAGPGLPQEVRDVLLWQLLSSPGAIVMGALGGLIINGVALAVHEHYLFKVFAVLEVLCCTARVVTLRAALNAPRDAPPPNLDLVVGLAITWCALQGAVALLAMSSGEASLQVLSATTIMGIIGPICSRNYSAPRLAFLLVCLLDLPFLAGACLSGQPWLLVLVPMTPLFLYSTNQIVRNFHVLAVTALTAKVESSHQAHHDPLTGLGNRLAFAREMQRPDDTRSESFVLLCLDLDGFKIINDTLGHQAGDRVLQGVAARLGDCVRPGDAAFRLGGDEFVVVAYGMPASMAGSFAERLIDIIAGEPFEFDDLPAIRIGLSVGYACSPDDGTDVASLHHLADGALYESKAAGKGVQRRCAPHAMAA